AESVAEVPFVTVAVYGIGEPSIVRVVELRTTLVKWTLFAMTSNACDSTTGNVKSDAPPAVAATLAPEQTPSTMTCAKVATPLMASSLLCSTWQVDGLPGAFPTVTRRICVTGFPDGSRSRI